MKYYLIIFLFLFSACSYRAKVKRIIDADTFVLENNIHVRMAEIDAPEHNQEYGNIATAFTRQYLEGKTVTLKTVDSDKYGRKVCEVWVNGVWFNELLVKNGLAWVYERYGSHKLYLEELTAKEQKIGLWQASNPVSPYNFRHNSNK